MGPPSSAMEQIDAQAADLRYLTQAPVSLTPGASVSTTYDTPQPNPHHSPGRSASIGANSAPPDHNAPIATTPGRPDSHKRKSIDDGSGSAAKQTRSKRNRYISIACNECKRRKIKCNGETPCHRCGNLNLACLYAPNCCSGNFKDTDDYRQITSQIDRMQEEIGWLNQTVRSLQADSARLPPLQDRPLPSASPSVLSQPSSTKRLDPPHTHHGSYRGPTSMAYSLDVANNTISNMGYKVPVEGDEQQIHASTADMSIQPANSSAFPDPLYEFDGEEMVRLCRLHDDEIGIMYPVVDIEMVISHARSLASFIQPLKKQRPLEPLNDEKTLQLKMVMCCALVVEDHGHSEKAERLYDSMEAVVNRKLVSDPSNVGTLPLLALLAGYRFLANEEILSWRIIGQVTRLCLELGINRYTGLMQIKDEQQRTDALNSFWTAYILDRRWAFGTGLPYVIQDSDIDPRLPIPEEHPFLVAMIAYSRLCAKVWQQVTDFEPVLAQELHQEEIERLDQEILEWYETVPEEIRMRNWSTDRHHMHSTPSYNLQRLRIWTYLRLNQIRTWLYTPVLHSATSIMANPVQAQRAVDLGRDTIRYLHHLNNTTGLYRRVQVFYHQFLTSAISVVFLASVHAPVRFSAICREEFYLALELVKDLSSKSWVSQRLWKTIRSLKDVAPRFGLDPSDDAHSTAALGMIGLARGHMESSSSTQPSPLQGSRQIPQGDASLDRNGALIQNEMSRIFEGYVGLNGVQSIPGYHAHSGATNAHGSRAGDGQSDPMGDDSGDTVFPQVKDLF